MKKIVYVSEESMVAGNGKCGLADVVDGLSNSCVSLYDVNIITQDHDGYITRKVPVKDFMDGVRKMRVVGANYYLVRAERWNELVPLVIDALNPDIFHNFAAPELITGITCKPNVTIYTIDHAKYVRGKEDVLALYDTITTVSETYAKEILAVGDSLSDFLKQADFRGITNGIVDSIFDPSTKFFLDAKYSAMKPDGKNLCKESLKRHLRIEGDPVIFSSIIRLSPEKGVQEILDNAYKIKELGGIVVLFGKGSKEFEEQAAELHKEGVIIYIHSSPSLMRLIPVLAGSDFYLSPSKEEPCGLMPMMASRYGAIPITTLVGGLKDNFNASNAIIIEDDLNSAIDNAFEMKPLEKRFMTAMVMSRNFSWKQRKDKYVDIYEQR